MKKSIAITGILAVLVFVWFLRNDNSSKPSSTEREKSGAAITAVNTDSRVQSTERRSLQERDRDIENLMKSLNAQRELTPAQRAENEREFARMREKIPGNMWIPGSLTEEERKDRESTFRDIVVLGKKVEKGTATPEEARRYYTLQIRVTGDKAEFIEYTLNRVAQLQEEQGAGIMKGSMMERGREAVERMYSEVEEYQEKLKEL